MNILVADDDAVTLQLMKKHVSSWGHTVFTAPGGLEAWDLAQTRHMDIVITDWVMPGLNGLELCQRIRNTSSSKYQYLIIVSAQNARQDIVRGLEGGIDDYLVKPLDFDELRARVEIGGRIITLERELHKRIDVIQSNFYQTIRMFTNLLEVFNEDLGGHCRRVAEVALIVARNMPEVDETDYDLVEATGLLHDIGMVGMSSSALGKRTTEMSGDERAHYRTHPIQGEMILSEIPALQPVAKLVRRHHEQVNGRGFPDGLSGNDIPIIARIIAGASAYDSLVNKWGIALTDVADHLNRQRGYQLESAIVDQLLTINTERIIAAEKRNDMVIPVEDVQIGMLLACSIRRKNGTLLMPQDTVITGENIEKLKTYAMLGTIEKSVSVHKSSSGR
ncbi:MAG: HD domain-containing phosphohydrolase [Pseudomonadota bacterium]